MTEPAYGRASLADLMPSVLASLGVPGEPATLGLPDAQRVVVLLVDGLGRELLERHADAAPLLSSLAGRTLTTGFPSTTVTSLSSFGTGLPPGEHGLTGYTSWAQEVEQTVGWLSWARPGAVAVATCAASWSRSRCSRGRRRSSGRPATGSR